MPSDNLIICIFVAEDYIMMKVTILQRDIFWADPAKNHQAADRAIEQAAGADLYILPEMFSTGFCTSPAGIAEHNAEQSLRWMKERAARSNAAIAGSVALEQQGRFYNRFYFVKPDGSVEFYDKRHLFTYGGEDKQFTSGAERKVVEWRGVRIMLQICYDLRFPVWSRNRGDYDMILYVASWPTPRIEAWSALLVARAIENQCYVAGVNRIGSDPNCNYSGGSVIIDPYGHTIAACADNTECEATAQVDMDMLNAFREKFPAYKDADPFTL